LNLDVLSEEELGNLKEKLLGEREVLATRLVLLKGDYAANRDRLVELERELRFRGLRE